MPRCSAALPKCSASRILAQLARIMDLNTGKVVWSSETQGASHYFRALEFDPSGRHLVVSQGSDTTSDDWAIVWYDATTMAEAARSRWDRKTSPSRPFLATGILLHPRAVEVRIRLEHRERPRLSRGADPSRRNACAALSAHRSFRPIW